MKSGVEYKGTFDAHFILVKYKTIKLILPSEYKFQSPHWIENRLYLCWDFFSQLYFLGCNTLGLFKTF